MSKVTLRNGLARPAGRFVGFGIWAGVWGFCCFKIVAGGGTMEHPIVMVPVLLFLTGAVGVLWNIVPLVDRTVKVTIDADGLHDHRHEGGRFRWDYVSLVRVRGERRNGAVFYADLTLELNSGRTYDLSIGGLDRAPEEVFRLVEGYLNARRRHDPDVAPLLAEPVSREHELD